MAWSLRVLLQLGEQGFEVAALPQRIEVGVFLCVFDPALRLEVAPGAGLIQQSDRLGSMRFFGLRVRVGTGRCQGVTTGGVVERAR